jgi:hypothetical protein
MSKHSVLKFIKYSVAAILLLVSFIAASIYLFAALQRSNLGTPIEELSDQDAGLYTARYINIGNNYYVLRLYRTKDQAFLAERMYFDPEEPRLLWEKDELIYTEKWNDWYFYEGKLNLPPTVWDRMMTYLP